MNILYIFTFCTWK